MKILICRIISFAAYLISVSIIFPLKSEGGINRSSIYQACLMRWRVQKVGGRQFAVSETIDGATYDLMGHFKSLEEAQQAGRLTVAGVLGKARPSYELDL